MESDMAWAFYRWSIGVNMDLIMDWPVHFRSPGDAETKECRWIFYLPGLAGRSLNSMGSGTPELLQPLVVVACCRHQTFKTWICWCHSIFPRVYPMFFAVLFQYFLLHMTHLLVMSLRIYFAVFTQTGGIRQQILHAKTQMRSHVLSMVGNITLLIYSRRKDKKEDEQHVI